MARGKLFEGWSFKLSIPEPFDDPKYSGAKDFGQSQYNYAGQVKKATLHAPTMRALLAYAKLANATEDGTYSEDMGVIGHQGSSYRIAEYCSANKRDCVVFAPNTGKFIASQFENGIPTPKAYTIGAGQASGSALLFCLMPVFEADTEFQSDFEALREAMKLGWPDLDASFENALRLCDNIYRRMENAASLKMAGVKVSVPATGNITNLSQLAIDNGSYAPTGAVYGDFTILKPGAGFSAGP